jgi:hypothetical protein
MLATVISAQAHYISAVAEATATAEVAAAKQHTE